MILFFAGIIAGIIMGVLGSALVIALRWPGDDSLDDCDLDELMAGIVPDTTPFMSEIERHRAKHLAASISTHL